MAVPDRPPTLAECVTACVGVLGADLTAYLAGARSPDQLADWAESGQEARDSAATARLLTARQVIEIFATANRVSLARSWLQEFGAVDDKSAPAVLIRGATDDETFQKVSRAATQFARTIAVD